jgi:hypothetical protein
MKSLNESGKTVVAIVAIVVLAGAFWLVLLQPKRDKAGELSKQEAALSSEVAAAQASLITAEEAKQKFPAAYRQLVLLGKAVPVEAETPSLLVQLDGLSNGANTNFKSISLGSSGEAAAAGEGEISTTLAPLGAAAGPAGLLAMPYALEFEGGFFEVANFMRKLDALVKTDGTEVSADGRLVMVDGFSLTPLSGEGEKGVPADGRLAAHFSVNTYVTPPGQGLTAGATAAGPASSAEIAPAETTPDEP